MFALLLLAAVFIFVKRMFEPRSTSRRVLLGKFATFFDISIDGRAKNVQVPQGSTSFQVFNFPSSPLLRVCVSLKIDADLSVFVLV